MQPLFWLFKWNIRSSRYTGVYSSLLYYLLPSLHPDIHPKEMFLYFGTLRFSGTEQERNIRLISERTASFLKEAATSQTSFPSILVVKPCQSFAEHVKP